MLDQLTDQQLKSLLNSAPVGLMALDSQGQISWLNDTMAGFAHQPTDALLGKTAETVDEVLRPLFEKNDTIFLPDDVDGPGHWLVRFRQVLADSDTQLLFFADVSLLQELAQEREQLQTRLEELVAVDTETGLPNRRALFEKLEPEVSRSRRYNNPLSIILMRIDGLAEITASHGAAVRQQMLVAISHMLNDQMRWADFIGRLDEHDFLLVLPETTLEVTEQLTGKIQARLATLHLESGDDIPFEIQSHFGTAQWRKGDDAALLLDRAQETLASSSDAA